MLPINRILSVAAVGATLVLAPAATSALAASGTVKHVEAVDSAGNGSGCSVDVSPLRARIASNGKDIVVTADTVSGCDRAQAKLRVTTTLIQKLPGGGGINQGGGSIIQTPAPVGFHPDSTVSKMSCTPGSTLDLVLRATIKVGPGHADPTVYTGTVTTKPISVTCPG